MPFSLLYYLVERHVSSRLRLMRLVWALLASGAALALLGIVQSATGWVVVNRDGILHNEEMQNAFRANSLFWDPNMFGRFCALVVLLGIACFLALRAGGYRSVWRRALPLTAAALAATALALTWSRSGLIALIAGAFVVELAWLGRKKGLIAVAVTLLVLVAGLTAITTVRDTTRITEKIQSTRGLNKLTGGRVYLLKAGWRMYERHPVRGIGLAGFPKAYPSYRRTHAASLALRESHTTPMTVAAEQGTVGLLAYGALLATFFATTLRRKRFGRRPRPLPAAGRDRRRSSGDLRLEPGLQRLLRRPVPLGVHGARRRRRHSARPRAVERHGRGHGAATRVRSSRR